MASELQRLVDEQANVMGVTSMPVKEEKRGSAATDKVQIFVNPSFADSVMGKAGLNGMRFVLAHELAHARGGCEGGHGGELAADRWATRSMVRAGLGIEPVEQVMSLLHGPATSSHPSSMARTSNARGEYQHTTREQPQKATTPTPRRKRAAETVARGPRKTVTPLRPGRFRER